MKLLAENLNKSLRRSGGFFAISFSLAFFTALTAIIGVSYGTWVSQQIKFRFNQLRGNRPSQIYSIYPPILIGSQFRAETFAKLLRGYGYEKTNQDSSLCSGCFKMENSEVVIRRPESRAPGMAFDEESFRIQWEEKDGILRINQINSAKTGNEFQKLDHPPIRVGVFSAGRLRTQDFVPLSEIPVYLRLAAMGIEDSQFLEHSGVSFRAIVRALWRDVRAGGFVQGGSTITQQLMKNLFFSRHKTITRKFKEAFYALIAEFNHSKEEILEAYLNEVYLGQWSSHEIHGVNEGARFYFNRSATELSLNQSAALAAMIQAPNIHDPKKNPEKLKNRRDLVLKRMFETNFIEESEYISAVRESLGIGNQDSGIEDIDYYLELALSGLPPSIRDRLNSSALNLYIPMNPRLQKAASISIRSHLYGLQDRISRKKIEMGKTVSLEGALIAIDVSTCQVLASQGGRSFRLSPFNRILQGKRQSGSLLKPFVYLAGLLANDPITPETILSDTPFEWEYDRQVWKPKNYDNKFRGDVTVQEALEQSLNVPTARLAKRLGLSAISETLRSAGVQSPLYEVPSLSLGSVGLSPLEVAKAYLTLARLGNQCQLHAILSAFDENGNELYRSTLQEREVFPKDAVKSLVEMMRGVMIRGTGQSAKGLLHDEVNFFSGKTGTTSEYRDAWFAGFSPDILALVWVGYDEKEMVGLTGASAALPIWSEFMDEAKPYYLPRFFTEGR